MVLEHRAASRKQMLNASWTWKERIASKGEANQILQLADAFFTPVEFDRLIKC